MRLRIAFPALAALGLLGVGCSGSPEYNKGTDVAKEEAEVKNSAPPTVKSRVKVTKPPGPTTSGARSSAPIKD